MSEKNLTKRIILAKTGYTRMFGTYIVQKLLQIARERTAHYFPVGIRNLARSPLRRQTLSQATDDNPSRTNHRLISKIVPVATLFPFTDLANRDIQ